MSGLYIWALSFPPCQVVAGNMNDANGKEQYCQVLNSGECNMQAPRQPGAADCMEKFGWISNHN